MDGFLNQRLSSLDGSFLGFGSLNVCITFGVVGCILDSLVQFRVSLLACSLACVKESFKSGYFCFEIHTAGSNLFLQILDVVIIVIT